MSEGFIYFIEREGADMVKIGWTRADPFGRMKTLQTGCPEPLTLRAYFPASKQDEARLHRTFAEMNYRSEWFFCQHKLRDLINYLTEYEESGPAVPRQRFEDAVWDVLVTGYEFFMDAAEVEIYRSSADAREWHFLFPDEDIA